MGEENLDQPRPSWYWELRTCRCGKKYLILDPAQNPERTPKELRYLQNRYARDGFECCRRLGRCRRCGADLNKPAKKSIEQTFHGRDMVEMKVEENSRGD